MENEQYRLGFMNIITKNCCINWIRQWFSMARIFRHLDSQHAIWILKHFEFVMGGMISCKKHLPAMHNGDPLPWYTYAALHFLDQFDFSSSQIFEFGSGNSSLYWANKAQDVSSMEIDESWYKRMAGSLLPNQALTLEPDPELYAKALISCGKKYDVVIVDGAARLLCVIEAISCIKTGGILILDNSDWFPDAVSVLRDKGFEQIDFIGPGPINKYTWATSIFFQDKIQLVRKASDGSIMVTGGIK